MTGIERLVDIVNDGPYSGGMVHISVQKLREICEQIEREADDISGYESDVLAWVEKNGGLDAVRERTMPEGMSWPFYEDGEPVRIGEYVICDERCSPAAVDFIEFNESGFKLYGESGRLIAGSDMPYGERVKRPAPAVHAADGKPLEVGQTVWRIDTGAEYWVKSGQTITADAVVIIRKTDCDCESEIVKASQLTHQRPVLDANGVPIDEGDTVWDATTSAEPFTVREIERSDDPDEQEDIVWCGEHAANGFKVWRIANQLTHTKPEPSDSWEKVEKDADLKPRGYVDLVLGWDMSKNHSENQARWAMTHDLVRRCRALAEKENRNE